MQSSLVNKSFLIILFHIIFNAIANESIDTLQSFVDSNTVTEKYIDTQCTHFPQRSLTVHQSIIHLFDIENPCFEIGLEYKITNTISTQIDAGPLIPRSIISQLFAGDDTHNGYRIDAQLKYWMPLNTSQKYCYGNNAFLLFLSVNAFFIQNNYNCNTSFIYSDSTHSRSPDTLRWYLANIDIHKQQYGVNFLFGFQYKIKRWVLRPSGGIGIKHRYATHTGKKYPQDKFTNEFLQFMDLEGNEWMPNFESNFTVGYLF